MSTDEALINTRQAAVILGISHATALRRARAGELPVHSKAPGYRGVFMFQREAIERLAGRTPLDKAVEVVRAAIADGTLSISDVTESQPPAG